MEIILIIIINLIFFAIGLILGYLLNKEKVAKLGSNIKVRFIKPEGKVIDSKEENSLNKIEDDVNAHHNDHFDEQR